MDVFKLNLKEIVYLSLSLLCVIKNAASLNCFQCDSTQERTCGDSLPQHHTLFADSCDHIQEALYCVKMTGLFEGELGTKRFCSARDWGNYCEWVRRPGDEREYRACVFSCSGNSCNKGHKGASPSMSFLLIPAVLSVVVHRAWCLWS